MSSLEEISQLNMILDRIEESEITLKDYTIVTKFTPERIPKHVWDSHQEPGEIQFEYKGNERIESPLSPVEVKTKYVFFWFGDDTEDYIIRMHVDLDKRLFMCEMGEYTPDSKRESLSKYDELVITLQGLGYKMGDIEL